MQVPVLTIVIISPVFRVFISDSRGGAWHNKLVRKPVSLKKKADFQNSVFSKKWNKQKT